MGTPAMSPLTFSPLRLESKTQLLLLPLFPPSTTLLIFCVGLQDVRFPQDEAVAPSSPFLEEDEGGKKDTWLAELAGERLMAATSCRSLRENPFKIAPPPHLPPSIPVSGASPNRHMLLGSTDISLRL